MKRLLTSAALFLCSLLTFAQFSGSGSGTESDPYLILNPIQLNQLRNFLNKSGVYFKLMADIDLTEFLEDENPDQGWQPVGTPSAPFNGNLDGNGKTISGLWINRSNTSYVGLFGYCVSATIKKLAIEDVSIKGNNYVGVLSGYSSYGSVSNCNLSGKIEGNNYTSGCLGECYYTTVSGVYSKVDVFGYDYVGGIVGSSTTSSSSRFFSCCHVKSFIIGNNYVGGISGFSSNSGDVDNVKLVNCSYVGHISGNMSLGGLCGETKNGGLIKSSYSLATISGTGEKTGGIIGNSNRSFLEDCYYNGTVNGLKYTGGLIGYQQGGYIKHCYTFGEVSGTSYVGGLIGYAHYYSGSYIKSNFIISTFIKATEGIVGRIYGDTDDDYQIGKMGTSAENKSYNKTIVISKGVAKDITDDLQNGTGVSSTTLKLKATYVAMGWDFTDAWAIQETECYPYMKSQTAPPVITSQVVSGATTVSGKCVDGGTITLEIDGEKQQIVSSGNSFSFTVNPLQAGHEVRVSAKADGKEQSYYTTEVVSFLGKGTEADPYQISTAADLTQVYRKGYYKLMNDIDLTKYINQFYSSEGWESIGRDGSETIYFDGNNHKVTGLWCNSTRDNTGLFSCFANGYIKNLTVETANGKQVKGGANTGILIGKMIKGRIENCRVAGNLSDGTPVGGVVGLMVNGTISKCRADVTINTTGATSYVGGLVGEITAGKIDQCFTTGTLSATGNESYVGGLIGKNTSTVTNSYSSAVVSSSYNAAGLVAYNYSVVDKCYAYGNLFSNNYAAGVIGYNDGANAVVKNCAAMNNKIDVVYESQQVQQGGGYGQRIIGGIKNSAPAPELNNYALKSMQVSVNDVAQKVYDDIMNGAAKTDDELKTSSTYTALGWDLSSIWSIDDGNGYPYLIGNVSSQPVTSVSFDFNTITLSVGSSKTIKANVLPEDAVNKELYWESSNNDVATVSNGVVTAVGEGSATITATTTDGSNLKASCEVTVTSQGDVPMVDDTDISQLANAVYIESTEVKTGSQMTLSIKMKNETPIRGFQFDLYLPDGVTVAKNAKDRIMASLSAGRLPEDDEHSLTIGEQADGAIRFLCSSLYDETFTGNDGEIVTLTVNVSDNIDDGDYPLIIKNARLTETDISKYYIIDYVKSTLTVSSYMLGDINADNEVDVRDYTGVANHIMGNTPDGFVVKAGDVDENGDIDVRDYTGIANIIMGSSVYGSTHNSVRALKSKTYARVASNIDGMDNVIYATNAKGAPGSQIELSICMKNQTPIRGFQFDLHLPEGVSIVKNAKGRIMASLAPGRLPEDDEHTLVIDEVSDGVFRFLCSSLYDENFTGNEGEIVTLTVNINADMAYGDYAVLLKNIVMTETDISKFYKADNIESVFTVDASTGVSILQDELLGVGKNNESPIYSIDGQLVGRSMDMSKSKKGIYIRDGKKIVVK